MVRLIAKTKYRAVIVLHLALIVVLPVVTLEAQTKQVEWEVQWKAKVDVEREDNIFHLSTNKILKLERSDSMVQLSGRYDNMNSVDDFILPVSLEFNSSRDEGLFGLPFSMQAGIEYQGYVKNPKRSHFVFDVAFLQDVSKKGRIRIRSEYIPSYFWKNYLADATDLTGNVNSAERVYKPGVYSEWGISVDYRHHFGGWLHSLDGGLLLQYSTRSYDDPFPGRNRDVLLAGIGFDYDLAKWWNIEVGFEYESTKSPVTPEVMILDEPAFRMDFNHDLDIVDNNRRTIQNVDRSRSDQNIQIGTIFKPTKKILISVGFEHLYRNYASQEPLDPGHRDRSDNRNTWKLGFDYTVYLGLQLRAKYQQAKQTTTAPLDPGFVGEETAYENQIFGIGLKWSF